MKIDLYNFELYSVKVGAFFLRQYMGALKIFDSP